MKTASRRQKRTGIPYQLLPRSAQAVTIASLLFCATIESQANLLNTLAAQGLSLIELGSYGKVRSLDLRKPSFATHKPYGDFLLVGVSPDGDYLIVTTQSPYSHRSRKEIEIITVQGQVIATILPAVRGLTMLFAELSPDRSMVSFVGNCAEGGRAGVKYGVHVVDLSGRVRTLITTTEAEEPHSIGWSADGKSIVYDSANGIYLYHLETRTNSFVADGSYPTWSPDGSWIAYRRPDGTGALVTADVTRLKSLKIHPSAGLRWSPDSRYLLFRDAGEIRVLDLDSGAIATVFMPIDQYTETRLRWVRGLPE